MGQFITILNNDNEETGEQAYKKNRFSNFILTYLRHNIRFKD